MASTPTISSKFPKAYGDFAIRSGDGVTCYFPSTILTYMSCVFQDMLSLPSGQDHPAASADSTDVTEPLNILELFLTHIDPKMCTPSIDLATIEDLLIMADKYQALSIMQWFEREAITQRAIHVMPQSTEIRESFIHTHPLIALALADRFNLVHLTRLVVAEIAGCDAKYLRNDNTTPRYLQALRLRDNRIKRYQSWIQKLAEHRESIGPKYCYGIYITLLRKDDEDLKVCSHCVVVRAKWIFSMLMAVQESPKWSHFEKAYHFEDKCCSISWPQHFESYIRGWREEAQTEEGRLPD